MVHYNCSTSAEWGLMKPVRSSRNVQLTVLSCCCALKAALRAYLATHEAHRSNALADLCDDPDNLLWRGLGLTRDVLKGETQQRIASEQRHIITILDVICSLPTPQ